MTGHKEILIHLKSVDIGSALWPQCKRNYKGLNKKLSLPTIKMYLLKLS